MGTHLRIASQESILVSVFDPLRLMMLSVGMGRPVMVVVRCARVRLARGETDRLLLLLHR